MEASVGDRRLRQLRHLWGWQAGGVRVQVRGVRVRAHGIRIR